MNISVRTMVAAASTAPAANTWQQTQICYEHGFSIVGQHTVLTRTKAGRTANAE
jgi:hypothetical protein